jgi:hypothetical protein
VRTTTLDTSGDTTMSSTAVRHRDPDRTTKCATSNPAAVHTAPTVTDIHTVSQRTERK